MTRDQTVANLILHGWTPFQSGSTLLGIKIRDGIFNSDSRWAIVFQTHATPPAVRWERLDGTQDLEACGWDELDDRSVEVFGNVYDQEEVGLGGLAQLQQSVAVRNARLDAIESTL